MRIIFNAIIIIFLLITGYIELYAGIICKEPYSIPGEVKYKEKLNIAFADLTGELPEERQYVKQLLKDRITEIISAYKRIRINYSAVDFIRKEFSSSEEETKNIQSSKNPHIINQHVFLNVNFINNDVVSDYIKKNENSSNPDLPGIDILIAGNIVYNNNLELDITVGNYIYNKKYNLSSSGSFREIDKLITHVSGEIIKSIIANYSMLNITCDQSEALIYIDDRYFGQTDQKNIILESGEHKVIVYKEKPDMREFEIDLKQGMTESLYAELKDISRKKKNTVSIITKPDKARIYLDSEYKGQSPLVIKNITDGVYRIRIEKQGFITKYETVKTENGDRKEISISLEQGDSKEYYFKRTTAYDKLYKSFLLGAGISAGAYLFFAAEEKYELYEQISIYSFFGSLIFTVVFYYLDVAKDDIEIAGSISGFRDTKYIYSLKPEYIINDRNINTRISIGKKF